MENKKTVIITGSNSGLGFECARNIATSSSDYRVILACRNLKKAEQAKSELVESTGNADIFAMELDLASISSVCAFAENYKALNWPLYGILCNAGINAISTDVTPDGFDIVFATNHLGHFLLTALLLPFMQSGGRIGVVSSGLHDSDKPEWLGVAAMAYPTGDLVGTHMRYSLSKLCNVYFTYELSRRLARIGSDITVNAYTPGLMVDTNFVPEEFRNSESYLKEVAHFVSPVTESAAALTKLMIDPDYGKFASKYFNKNAEEEKSSALSYSLENALELWNTSVQYTKLEPHETVPGLL